MMIRSLIDVGRAGVSERAMSAAVAVRPGVRYRCGGLTVTTKRERPLGATMAFLDEATWRGRGYSRGLGTPAGGDAAATGPADGAQLGRTGNAARVRPAHDA